MRRFGFFLAVFSIGLVLFLLVSGQFGAMFPGKAGPGAADLVDSGEDPLPGEPADEEVVGDGATGPVRNLLRTEETDYDLGRPLFFIEGALASAVRMDVTMRTQMQEFLFEDVKLELPLYSDRDAIEPVDSFLLTIEEVRYDALAGLQDGAPRARSTSEVELIGALTGKGMETGYPEFVTRDGRIVWDDDSHARLSGEERLDLRYPAVTLRTQSGFEAEVAGQSGLSSIELLPPLVVALPSDATGSILGFEGAPAAGESEGGSGSRVHLFSLGAMRIDPANSTANIEGPIFIYQVPEETSLNPPEVVDLPAHHFRCERLSLELDTETRAITRLVAEKREEPVQIRFGESYRVEGDRLEWSRGDREARLDGAVRIVGDLGVVTAGAARLRPDDGTCRLINGVRARLSGRTLAQSQAREGDAPAEGWDARLAGDWEMLAQTATLTYSSESRKQSLRSLRAVAAAGDRVTLREQREDGAVVLGGEMSYDPEAGMVSIIPGADDRLPEFIEGRNRGSARRIGVSLLSTVLEFEGEVAVDLVEPPAGMDERWAQWWSPEGLEPGAVRTRLEAERVLLSSDADHQLSRIRGWGTEAAPLLLEHRGERTLRFLAREVDWDGARSRIIAGGEGEQRMILEGRADIAAQELEYSIDDWVAFARGRVNGRWERLGPAKDGEETLPPIVVRGDTAEVRFRPPEVAAVGPGDEGANNEGAEDEDAEIRGAGAASDKGARSGEVIAAHVRADQPDGLTVEDGSMRLVGDEWIWDAVADEFRLGSGRGPQRVISRTPFGDDEVSADHVVYRGADQLLLLEGGARGTIHQGSVAPELEPDSAHLPWQVSAGRMTLRFRRDPAERQLVPERLVATDEIRLTQRDSLIEFRGSTAEWDVDSDRIHIHTPDGRGFQTLTQGGVSGSEVIAREILIVRPTTLVPGSIDTIEALFVDVLKAEIRLAPDDAENPDRPTGFTMNSDNMLATFSGLREGELDEGDPLGMPISEVRSWGGVDFQGGQFHLVCHRATYRRSTRTLVFQGDGRSKVQVLSQEGAAIRPLTQRELSLEWLVNRSFRVRSVPGGSQWSGADIEESLRLFDRLDRRDTAE